MSNTDSTRRPQTRPWLVVSAFVVVAVGLVLGALPVLDGDRFDGRSIASIVLVIVGAVLYLTSTPEKES